MWDLEAYAILAYFSFIIVILAVEIIGIIIVAGAIASYFGFSGILWWAVAIVMFLIINAILNGLRSWG